MCGIVAIINGGSVEQATAMLEKIKHRGPDSQHVSVDNGAVIGFNRLGITDADSAQSVQPGHCQGTTVYFNGEIYNYRDLHPDKSEVQTIAWGIHRYGMGFVKKLNGMFAMLVHHKGEWYVVRDRYGIKPLYYWVHKGTTYISSEIKAFTAIEHFTPRINKYAVDQWQCLNNIVSGDTLFQGVFPFPAASIVNISEFSCKEYWNWEFRPQEMTYSHAVAETRRLVRQAIQRQVPKIPYATCLSGGVDSGIIRSVLGDVKSFSVGYTSVRDERELIRTQEVEGYHVVYSDVEYFDETMYHLESPRVGASWPNYGLYQLASKYVRVLFDGAGADELFGGYTWRYMAENYRDVLSRTGLWNSVCQSLMECKLGVDSIYSRYQVDAQWFLPGVLEVVDKLSMAHSVEIRVPFLDNDLVDFAVTIPSEYKFDKQILKDAFSDVLPAAVIHGSKKGFTSPDWIDAPGETQAERWSNAALNKLTEIYFQS